MSDNLFTSVIVAESLGVRKSVDRIAEQDCGLKSGEGIGNTASNQAFVHG